MSCCLHPASPGRFLPNLRFFRKITTFGNLDLPIYTHDIEDIGHIGALAVTDDCTLNKCVQVDDNALTQNEMLALLKKYWPENPLNINLSGKIDLIINA